MKLKLVAGAAFGTGRGHSRAASAFSLIEVIVVMSIVIILALLSVPAIEQMLKGSRLSIASSAVIDELSLAQQTALSRSVPVEVRIYKLPSTEAGPGGTPTEYRAMQSFLNNGNVLTPLGKVTMLPPAVIIEPSASKSSIFETGTGVAPLLDPDPKSSTLEIPGFDTNYEYVSFRFKGNGETDMNQLPAFFTLVSKIDPVSSSGLPLNYVVIQIDPLTGRARTYRP